MKALRISLTVFLFAALLSSCSVWNRVFPSKYGCGTNGKKRRRRKNNDAISGGEKLPKAKKFKD